MSEPSKWALREAEGVMRCVLNAQSRAQGGYGGPVPSNIIAFALDAARRKGFAEGKDAAAGIVASHPDEDHPDCIDPELVRGCCEAMEERIRALKEPT